MELPTGTRLPVPRPGALPVQRSRASRELVEQGGPGHPHHHAAPRRRNVLLGPFLVGAIILVVLVTLALAATLKG